METLEQRVQAFKSEFEPLLNKYKMTMGVTPQFPIYKIIPIEIQLALKVLEKYGVQYNIVFQEVK